jgi:3-hydroxybutyryl-CoA dehydrogenase
MEVNKVTKRVGVVGCGIMGSGIAEVTARAGIETVVCDADEGGLSLGRRRIEESLARAVKASRLSDSARDDALKCLRFTTDLEEMVDRDLVVEAVVEDESTKLDLFSRIDRIVTNPTAVMASNTSSIPIMKLAMATKRPGSVVGVHFFNPVPVRPLVEVVTSLVTSAEAVEEARHFAHTQLGKTVIESQDRAGFIVNALLIPYLLSAIRMFESGFATAKDVDSGMVLGCAHPMGPLALADLIGLDTTQAVAVSMYEEFKDSHYAPPPLLARMVEAGLLGRKTGQGFYSYGGDA